MPQVPRQPDENVHFAPGHAGVPSHSYDTLPINADEETTQNPNTGAAAALGNLASGPKTPEIETSGEANWIVSEPGEVNTWRLGNGAVKIPHQSAPLSVDEQFFGRTGIEGHRKAVLTLTPPEKAGDKPGAELYIIDQGEKADPRYRFLVTDSEFLKELEWAPKSTWRQSLGKKIWAFAPGDPPMTFGRGEKEGPEPGLIKIPGADTKVSKRHITLEFGVEATTVTNVSETQWTDVKACSKMKQLPQEG
ncbi:MAG TPA: hypothetical protein VFB59_01500 [Candidatus Saccharimonadales bacterium]|nr:hypothetical protein [Candidatus Saccharimonadales bacterium]